MSADQAAIRNVFEYDSLRICGLSVGGSQAAALSFLRISTVEQYLCFTGSHGFLQQRLVDYA
jgi:hypothetical protein